MKPRDPLRDPLTLPNYDLTTRTTVRSRKGHGGSRGRSSLTSLPVREGKGEREPLTFEEETELQQLVFQAFELRRGPYAGDAAQAVVDWWERRHVRRLERRQTRVAEAIRLLRESSHLVGGDRP